MGKLDILLQEFREDPAKSGDAFWLAVREHAMKRFRGDEDLAQTVLLAVIEDLDQFRGDSPFTHWLNRIITNVDHYEHRKTARDPEIISIDERFDETLQSEPPAPWKPVNMTGVKGVDLELCRLLLQGHTIKDAALQAGLTPAAARKRLQRLRDNRK